jgi:hypothetical protein
MIRLTMALLTLLAISGCSLSPEQKVRDALIRAGLSDRMATCMAGQMAADLSIDQLMKLRSLEGAKGADGHLSRHELTRRVRALDDPAIAIVTARAAAGCAILG